MSQSKALAVFHVLWQAEQAFKRNLVNSADTDSRVLGWRLLEQAEQDLVQIEPETLFFRAQRHCDRIWRLAGEVMPIRGDVTGLSVTHSLCEE